MPKPSLKPIYVWGEKYYGASTGRYPTCPWCSTPTMYVDYYWEETESPGEFRYDDRCPLCGWKHRSYADYGESPRGWDTYSALHQFDLTSPAFLLPELATYLRRNSADVCSLRWCRFEDLVRDLFRQRGFNVRLTKPSGDGSANIIVLENGSAVAIVECKLHSDGRLTGVELVPSLVGACVDWDVKTAYLVTTTEAVGQSKSYSERIRQHGYKVDLVCASDLLKLLGVYNADLPSMDRLTPQLRSEIVEANSVDSSRRP